MSKLRNILIGAGVAAIGAIGTKKAIDYFRNRDQEEVVDESEGLNLYTKGGNVHELKAQGWAHF